MGRYSYSTRGEADSFIRVNIWQLKGNINSLESKNKCLEFHCVQTGKDGREKLLDYDVRIVTTPCNYGGFRHWFICPLVKNGIPCNKRVGTLYKVGDYFGCRHCYNLTYRSRRENRTYKNYPLLEILVLEEKIAALEAKIKRSWYAGRLTKKQRRIEKIYDRFYRLRAGVIKQDI